MDKVQFLKALTEFTREVTKDMILPVSLQKEDDGQQKFRAPEVHQMRLPDSRQAKKKAPYIIHQIVTGTDTQGNERKTTNQTVVRSIFCVYCADHRRPVRAQHTGGFGNHVLPRRHGPLFLRRDGEHLAPAWYSKRGSI